MANKKRVFLAIIPPKKIISTIERSIIPLRVLPIRFLDEQMWHITIHFLGYVDKLNLKVLDKIAKRCVENTQTFKINASSVSWGPPDSAPRMIWLNLDVPKEYLDLALCFKTALKESQKTGKFPRFIAKKEQFGEKIYSHITLARFEQEDWGKVQHTFENLKLTMPELNTAFDVSAIYIMESRLSRQGAKYNKIGEYTIKMVHKP
ncbi:MAG: RNA 2',3'-cyclic phosphodiesterase [Patescibacteria group bacterium]